MLESGLVNGRPAMWKARIPELDPNNTESQSKEFDGLLRYIQHLAKHKLGYPVSLLTYIGLLNNEVLGIKHQSLADVLLNNVGDPFKDSETSLMEVKRHERLLMAILGRYYGLHEDDVRGYVTTGGTEGNFASLWWSKRFLINSDIERLLEFDTEIKKLAKEEHDINAQLTKIPFNDYKTRAEKLEQLLKIKNAITENKNITQEILTPTVFFAQGSTHYSIPKIAEILRFNIRQVAANEDGSINLEIFKRELLLNLSAKPYSSIIFVANIGTTITGAIDNLPEIKKILDSMPSKPLYTIHMDGALSGFVLPILKPFGDIPNYFSELGVNTLAVSAHKYPGLSQPCGVLISTKSFYDKTFEKSERSIEYVGNILDVTISGSRSGLNVLMFYNALISLGLDINNEKLQHIVEHNIRTAQYLRDELTKLYGEKNVKRPHHFNVMFPKPTLALTKKYQLMITGKYATVCVLPNVTRPLIDEFISELKRDQENAMILTATNTTYSIEVLNDSHFQSALSLFIRAFCDVEPITKALKITHEEYTPFAEAVLKKAIEDKMSMVAVNDQNEVLACVIAEDIANPFIPTLSLYPVMKPIFAIIDKLDRAFTENRLFLKGKVARFWIASVKKDQMNRGLFKELNAETIKLAASKGFEFAYAEFTNPISEKIVRQFDLITECNRVSYKDFTMRNGQKPFESLPGEASSYVAAIRPGVQLDSLSNCYTITKSDR